MHRILALALAFTGTVAYAEPRQGSVCFGKKGLTDLWSITGPAVDALEQRSGSVTIGRCRAVRRADELHVYAGKTKVAVVDACSTRLFVAGVATSEHEPLRVGDLADALATDTSGELVCRSQSGGIRCYHHDGVYDPYIHYTLRGALPEGSVVRGADAAALVVGKRIVEITRAHCD